MTNPIHILHLEDNSMDSDLIEYLLHENNMDFILLRIETEEDFIKQLDEFKPNIILVDQTLPTFDGITALKITKTKYPTIPVIFVTGTMNDEIAIKTIKLGADDYIIKDRISRLPESITRAILASTDTIKLKKTEQELIESNAFLEISEKKFRTIFQSSADALILEDHNTFIECNPATLQMFNVGKKENIIGQNIFKFFKEQHDNNFLIDYCKKSLLGDIQRFEWICIKTNKLEFFADVVMASLMLDKKQLLHISIRDITDTKNYQNEIEQHAAQLQQTFLQTVHLITELNQLRDPYTTGHEQRVAELAVAIGQELKLSSHQILGLRVGGYLHDIGKIAIPIEILTKPGKLTKLEMDFIKTHTTNGYNILKNIDFPWPIELIAYQHHERLDGNGYPNGLKAENKDIILEARIIAVADVIEAMSSHRPYRPGLGIDNALNEIIKGRGTLYDPIIVNICVNLFKEQNFNFPQTQQVKLLT